MAIKCEEYNHVLVMTPSGDFAAAAVLSGLPITLVFVMAQRWIVSGLTSGGVKG